MKRIIYAALLSAATALALLGCHGGSSAPGTGGNGSGDSGSGARVGRLTSVVTWKMPDDVFARLTPQARASLAQKGITVDDTAKTLVSPELPLAGHWVKVGEQQFRMTDRDGLFTVPDGAPGSGNAPVFSQIDGTVPEGEVPLGSLVPQGKTPNTVRLQLAYVLPADMNVDAATRTVSRSHGLAHGPDGCALREECLPPGHPEGNKKPCCLDYDGDTGDGLARLRGEDGAGGGNDPGLECSTKAYVNFINSTCYLWTFAKNGRPCASEGAINDVGPSCWVNHRYRNCQNMDENDLQVTPKIKVAPGGRVTFQVRNNTAGNHTRLTFQETNVPGKLEVDAAAPSSGADLVVVQKGYVLAHFSNERKEHYNDVTLAYTAPDRLPDGECKATYHLTAEGGGLTGQIEIEVSHLSDLELTPASTSVKVGQSVTLTALARDGAGNPVQTPLTWDASGGAVSVDASGNVTGVAEGASVITVRSKECPDLRATATVTVTKNNDDGEAPKPEGRHNLVRVNGQAPPVVLNEYHDDKINYTWRLTTFGGFIDLRQDGTFQIERKGGEFKFPVTLKGSGTYAVAGNAIKFTYAQGSGPGEVAITGAGKLSYSYVIKKDNVQIFQDIPVTEEYSRQ